MAPTGNEGVDSGVSFELHRIVLLLFFLLDAAKTSPQTQNMSLICMPNEEEYEMSRNFADVLQTITVLIEIYWDLIEV